MESGATDPSGAPTPPPLVRTSSLAGNEWLVSSKCANKVLWGQFEFLKNRRVISPSACHVPIAALIATLTWQVTAENQKINGQILKDVGRTLPHDSFLSTEEGREVSPLTQRRVP